MKFVQAILDVRTKKLENISIGISDDSNVGHGYLNFRWIDHAIQN